jgi:hypothetical protein
VSIEEAAEASSELPRHRYSVHMDHGPIVLRAFWSMHAEAMDSSGMGRSEYVAALGLSFYWL